jgi:thymidylate synthase (FAD)
MTVTPASLIWITPNAEAQIAYCARVSNPKNQTNPDAAKLLNYCAKHGHWSVFEMASACFEINTTRDISAQILRHRSFSFQEFSQRYSPIECLGSSRIPHLRRQDKSNRQNSIDDLSPEVTESFYRKIGSLFEEAEHLYQEMTSAGVAKECARKVLPMNSPTRLYMSGTIRSWIHYVSVRANKDTQLEHRQIALLIKEILCRELPSIKELLNGD